MLSEVQAYRSQRPAAYLPADLERLGGDKPLDRLDPGIFQPIEELEFGAGQVGDRDQQKTEAESWPKSLGGEAAHIYATAQHGDHLEC
jgi:hypothetical protein